ncbi:MAG: Smr/MutS family protein [Bacteroidales bacterium]|jgi:DNA mismatch repair protein MutS2|nr:Smr/MutS family protein [Bacteroidales bacterium]
MIDGEYSCDYQADLYLCRMIYPEQFEAKLGFDKLRKKLIANCLSPATHTKVQDMHFMTNKKAIQYSIDFTEEMKQILMFHDSFPIGDFPDLVQALHKLEDKNSVLTEQNFKDLIAFLENFQAVQRYGNKLSEKKFPILKAVFANTEYPKWVKDRIRQIFNTKGEMKSSASKTLQNLSDELSQLEQKIRRNMEQIMRKAADSGWSSSDTSVAIIDGQRAIPIENTHKRKIPGYIIGESGSGKTVYVVPEAFSIVNNQIRNTEALIHQEKLRILAELSDDIREYQAELLHCFTQLTEIDFHRTKAKLSIALEAISPAIVDDLNMKYHKARHPILFLNFKGQNREVVPFTIEFTSSTRFFVISGPNAGGKSVSLQTVGLLQYMVQCGLQIPVGGNTEIAVMSDIFIDLGDDQSIENDLSTYSSHLKNMKYMLKHAKAGSLILIDEFGGGTDPEMGSAIAEAMLQQLVDQESCGIITTHYTNLKHFASNYPSVENAAMLIDANNMEPLFQLETGIPGSSHSFEIAHRSGIPQEIIELARSKVGKDQYSFDKHLRQVIRDKRYWENKRKEIQLEQKKIDAEINRNAVAYESFKRKEKQIITEAQGIAQKLIKDANREIENTIRKIKEAQADKEKTREARRKLDAEQQKIKKTKSVDDKLPTELKNFENTLKTENPKPKQQAIATKSTETIGIGSGVFIQHLDKQGEVVDMSDKSYVVRLGNLLTTVQKSKVTLSKEKQSDIQKSKRASGTQYYERILNFRDHIDLRGKRGDEALNELIEFCDNAVVNGAKEVKILHGKGGGILRNIIRDYLSKRQEVQSFQDEDVRFGGDGITVVQFRV